MWKQFQTTLVGVKQTGKMIREAVYKWPLNGSPVAACQQEPGKQGQV